MRTVLALTMMAWVFGLAARLPLAQSGGNLALRSVPSIAAAPTGSGRIAFISDRGGKGRIYSMNADGSDISILIDPPGSLWQSERFAFSPDGRKIAFHSHMPGECCQLHIVDADGTNLTRVTSPPGEYDDPAFGPDGRKIAFTSARGLYYKQIYVMNLDGSNVTRLTNLRGDSSSPAISPDGRKIAFVSGPAPWTSRPDGSVSYGIYSMNADGSHITRLIGAREANWQAFSHPSFSSDGRKIVYVFADQRVYIMNVDGSGVITINNSPMVITTGASLSPDGRRIAFSCQESICVMNADGSGIVKLTDGWSPVFIP